MHLHGDNWRNWVQVGNQNSNFWNTSCKHQGPSWLSRLGTIGKDIQKRNHIVFGNRLQQTGCTAIKTNIHKPHHWVHYVLSMLKSSFQPSAVKPKKEITLTNHKGRRQYCEPIKTPKQTPVRVSHNYWFWFKGAQSRLNGLKSFA